MARSPQHEGKLAEEYPLQKLKLDGAPRSAKMDVLILVGPTSTVVRHDNDVRWNGDAAGDAEDHSETTVIHLRTGADQSTTALRAYGAKQNTPARKIPGRSGHVDRGFARQRNCLLEGRDQITRNADCDARTPRPSHLMQVSGAGIGAAILPFMMIVIWRDKYGMPLLPA